MSRKLVTLRRITDIRPIANADAIEVAVVDGWECVVKKGEFEVGQYVLYFEIDSILPKGRPEFEFLMARGCKMQPAEDGSLLEGHRLRTIKLRGQVSQGLVIPVPEFLALDISEDGAPIVIDWQDTEMGIIYDSCDDLSNVFGVKKYEKPIPAQLAGMCRGNYPAWLPKTDQDRVQNCFNKMSGTFYFEEKLEGSSMTIYHDGEKVGVTSRNIDLVLEQEGNTFVDVAKASGLMELLVKYAEENQNTQVAVRGELIGPNIQGNIYGLTNHQFYIFDIFVNGRYLTVDERVLFIHNVLKDCNKDVVQCVRVLGTLNIEAYTVREVIEMSNGFSILNTKTRREGLVFKARDLNAHNQVVSFKAISPEYLLKEKE